MLALRRGDVRGCAASGTSGSGPGGARSGGCGTACGACGARGAGSSTSGGGTEVGRLRTEALRSGRRGRRWWRLPRSSDFEAKHSACEFWAPRDARSTTESRPADAGQVSPSESRSAAAPSSRAPAQAERGASGGVRGGVRHRRVGAGHPHRRVGARPSRAGARHHQRVGKELASAIAGLELATARWERAGADMEHASAGLGLATARWERAGAELEYVVAGLEHIIAGLELATARWERACVDWMHAVVELSLRCPTCPAKQGRPLIFHEFVFSIAR